MVAPNSRAFFTDEFKLSNLWFTTDRPLLLGTSQYGSFQLCYIVYRALWMLCWFALVIYDLTTYVGTDQSFYAYMSNWSIVLLVLSSFCQFVSSIYCHVRHKDLEAATHTPLLLKVNWFLYDMASPVAFFISVVYFTAIHTVQTEEQLSFITVCVHLVNSIYVLSDLFVTAVPFRVMHFWLPEVFGISYTIFSVIYWGATGAEPIYHILDYENSPGLSAVYLLCVAFIASPLFHVITFCLYWLRILLYGKFCPSSSDESTDREDVESRIRGEYRVDTKNEDSVIFNVKV